MRDNNNNKIASREKKKHTHTHNMPRTTLHVEINYTHSQMLELSERVGEREIL